MSKEGLEIHCSCYKLSDRNNEENLNSLIILFQIIESRVVVQTYTDSHEHCWVIPMTKNIACSLLKIK